MKKLKKMIKSGRYESDATYLDLQKKYTNAQAIYKSAKRDFHLQLDEYEAAAMNKKSEEVLVFRLHCGASIAMHTKWIRKIELKQARFNLFSWLSEQETARKAATAAQKREQKLAMKTERAISEKSEKSKPAASKKTKTVTPEVAADDLKKIEGIGPKIETVLHTAGILTFKKLSKTSVDDLKKMLLAANSRYKMYDPTTWPEQARLAADGKFASLEQWQAELKGGRKN